MLKHLLQKKWLFFKTLFHFLPLIPRIDHFQSFVEIISDIYFNMSNDIPMLLSVSIIFDFLLGCWEFHCLRCFSTILLPLLSAIYPIYCRFWFKQELVFTSFQFINAIHCSKCSTLWMHFYTLSVFLGHNSCLCFFELNFLLRCTWHVTY